MSLKNTSAAMLAAAAGAAGADAAKQETVAGPGRDYFNDQAFRKEYRDAAVAIARRGGTTASFDVMNKYFGISQMPVAGSTYWNIGHGRAPGEIAQDAEGLRTMRNLARSMAWMLKCFAAGKAAGVALPDTEQGEMTNFIR